MFPCSCYLEGEYGLEDICIGVPAVIGKRNRRNFLEILPLFLDWPEKGKNWGFLLGEKPWFGKKLTGVY